MPTMHKGGKICFLSIGAALQDVFLSGAALASQLEDGQQVEEFVLGGKYEIEKIVYATGGGATNAAVTFARQGFESSYIGNIGNDSAGQAIIDSLRQEKVKTDLVCHSKTHSTGYSVVLLAPNGDRVILIHRGASNHFESEKIKLRDVHTDWVYISTLAGDMHLLDKVISYAASRHIPVAINPGEKEIAQKEQLLKALHDVKILCINREEAAKLFGAEESWELVKEAVKIVPTVVVTDGPNGVVAGDRDSNQICSGGMYEDVPVIDRTGAGDAFASGFTAKIASGAKLYDAIVFASANSTSVVGKIGAKEGILKSDHDLHGMDLHCENLY